MPFSTITTPQVKPVANYKLATRMEGGRLLYISGQVAWDANGTLVGKGDIRAQARQVFQNLRNVLQAAGGDLSDLLKITTYITKIDDFPAVADVRSEVFPGELPASTLIVVKSLFHPDLLIEVESGTSAARHAAEQLAENTSQADEAVSLAAFACAEAYEKVAATAIQMHGGIAFTWEHPAHLYLRRARAYAQLFGSPALYRERYLTQLGG